MAVIGGRGFYDLTPYQQSQVWSGKRAAAIGEAMGNTAQLLNSLGGQPNSVASVLAGAGGGGSLNAILGGNTDTTAAQNANALFGGGLGGSPEEALQNAVTGGKSNAAIAEENLMAQIIKRRQAKEAEAKAGSKVNTIA
ncbi:hypothetical protein BN1110_04179 [bacterium YEK0313]|nr:hypothetical protein BN1110_04179 [bacterium YEK0313]